MGSVSPFGQWNFPISLTKMQEDNIIFSLGLRAKHLDNSDCVLWEVEATGNPDRLKKDVSRKKISWS